MAKTKVESFTGVRSTAGTRTLSFGLVNVTVGMQPLFDSAGSRRQGKMVCPDDHLPLKQVYRDEAGHEVSITEAHKAYTMDDGSTVVLDRDEQDAIKNAEDDTDVALSARVPERDIPAEFFTASYIVFPKTARDADGYALLARMLVESETALVGEMVDRGTSKVLVLRWSSRYACLVAHTLNYEANVRAEVVDTVREKVKGVPVPDELLAMAEQLFSALPSDFDWSATRDSAGDRLEAALREKAESGAVTVLPDTPSQAEAPADLMAALKASMAEVAGEKVA